MLEMAFAMFSGVAGSALRKSWRALDEKAPVTAWGGFEVGGWGDDDADVRAAPPPKKRPKHRYDAWDRSLDAPRRGHWDD